MPTLTPTQKKKYRAQLVDFCLRAEEAQWRWHYSQQRPFYGFGRRPEEIHVADCSGYLSLLFYWANIRTTGPNLDDPLGYDFSGYGNTGSEYEWFLKHAHHPPENKYLVGDMVIYGWRYNTVHTAICRKAGTRTTSIWSSNGNERSPQPVKVDYHPDPILGIWRHPGLA